MTDLAFAVGRLARYAATPIGTHCLAAAKSVLRYVNGTVDLALAYGGAHELEGFSYADFAGDLDIRRSTSGFRFRYHGAVVSWCRKSQRTVALSEAEAEYVTASGASREAL